MRILLITSTALFLIFTFSACNKQQPESKKDTNFSTLKNAVISYMSQPDFTNPGFTQQATGTNAELQIYDMDENMLYFSAVKNDFDKIEVLGKLTEVPEKVEFGFEQNGKSILGAYTLAGLHRYFFRFPKNDFKIDSTRMISVDFGKYKYNVSLKELADFANNVSVHGGSPDTNTIGNLYLANHGAFVSKGNEPSLQRLTRQLTGGETGKEKISQQLLDFVSGSLKFNNYEATGQYEVLKRPNEVLMTGGSDCSGLTILYASLLEQYDIGYILVYFKGHICAAVEGEYPAVNGLNIMHEGKNYTLAETTVKGFMIGVTPLDKSFSLEGITYIQKPGADMVKYKFVK
jgi:hypothetical protein